jgi:hypothetical protein
MTPTTTIRRAETYLIFELQFGAVAPGYAKSGTP